MNIPSRRVSPPLRLFCFMVDRAYYFVPHGYSKLGLDNGDTLDVVIERV